MKQFYLTAAAAMVVTTSLASNLLWVMAFGPRTVGVRVRLQSAFDGLRGLIDLSVAAAIARSERQAALFKRDFASGGDLSDIGLCRNGPGVVPPECDATRGIAPRSCARQDAGGVRQ